jgi:hypothetical protein
MHVPAVHDQLVNLQATDFQLAYVETPDGGTLDHQAADRKRPDRQSADRERADGKRAKRYSPRCERRAAARLASLAVGSSELAEHPRKTHDNESRRDRFPLCRVSGLPIRAAASSLLLSCQLAHRCPSG